MALTRSKKHHYLCYDFPQSIYKFLFPSKQKQTTNYNKYTVIDGLLKTTLICGTVRFS